MPRSKTKLYHTCPTEEPFECITGDLTGEGFLVVVDKSTHELVVRYGAEEGTITVLVNPKGVQVQGVSPRPGTRMLDINPSPSDPTRQAGESIERLKESHQRRRRRRRGGAIGAPRGGVNQHYSPEEKGPDHG